MELSHVVDDYIEKEKAAGRIIGPFQNPPFDKYHLSPLGVVPKKDSGKYRIIHHLSYPEGDSINDFISQDNTRVNYASVEDAIKLVKQAGRCAYMAKTDIKSAFRLIPIHKADHPLFCFQWQEVFYYDVCLQMGCSASCKIFETFSTALEWIAKDKLEISFMTHILDDFFLVNENRQACQSQLDQFLHLCHKVNVPIAKEKTLGPSTTLSFMGYEIDSIQCEVRLPQDKVNKCVNAIQHLLSRSRCTLKDMQSLIGLLNFACAVIIPGRAFLRRLIDLTIGIRYSFYSIRINKEQREDLSVWLEFLETYNGKRLYHEEMFFTPQVVHLYSDAAQQLGYACVFGNHYLYSAWPSSWWREQNITLLELVPVVLGLETWGDKLVNMNVVLHIDNEALVHVVNKQTSHEKLVMQMVRRLVRATLKYNILCKAVWVSGRLNTLSDSLSRLLLQKFKTLHPTADEFPTEHVLLPAALP